MLDVNFTQLATETSVVTATEYTNYGKSLAAPANTVLGAVTLYSEGPTWYDSCVVTASGTANPLTPAPITVVPDPVSPEVVLNPGIAAGPAVVTVPVLTCLLYTSPSPRDATLSRMPSSA